MFKHLMTSFVREDGGATAVEYGLMLALITIVCILVVSALGSEIADLLDETQIKVDEAGDVSKVPS